MSMQGWGLLCFSTSDCRQARGPEALRKYVVRFEAQPTERRGSTGSGRQAGWEEAAPCRIPGRKRPAQASKQGEDTGRCCRWQLRDQDRIISSVRPSY